MLYRIEYKHGDCHPETCCCYAYKVIFVSSGKTIASFINEKDAKELIYMLTK